MSIMPDVAALGVTALIAVLGYMGRQIGKLGEKLDQMVCDPLCLERSKKCQQAFCYKLHDLEAEDKKLWLRVNTHKHDGMGHVVITKESSNG